MRALELRLAGRELALRHAPVVVARPVDDRDLDLRRRSSPSPTRHTTPPAAWIGARGSALSSSGAASGGPACATRPGSSARASLRARRARARASCPAARLNGPSARMRSRANRSIVSSRHDRILQLAQDVLDVRPPAWRTRFACAAALAAERGRHRLGRVAGPLGAHAHVVEVLVGAVVARAPGAARAELPPGAPRQRRQHLAAGPLGRGRQRAASRAASTSRSSRST